VELGGRKRGGVGRKVGGMVGMGVGCGGEGLFEEGRMARVLQTRNARTKKSMVDCISRKSRVMTGNPLTDK